MTSTGCRPKVLDWVAMIILTVGGLNLGLVGLFSVDLLHTLYSFVSASFAALGTRIDNILVGASVVYLIVRAVGCCKACCKPKE